MQTVAEFLADELANAGVEVIYGLPGGENVEILDAIRQRGLEFVLVRNESSACFMADVTARLTGRPSVALTTLGPGATNATVGLAHAYLERSPVLLITAQSDPKIIGKHTHQVLDLNAIFRPITKFTAEVDEYNAVSTIRHALNTMQSGRPAPVHLGLPHRVAQTDITVVNRWEISAKNYFPDEVAMETTLDYIKKSKLPVIVLGLGLEPDKPYVRVQQLAEKLNALVIDTPKSKGALSAKHPLFVGTIGLTQTDPAYTVLDESDCIIAIGFDVVELVKVWNQPQPLIWIANWSNQDPRIEAVCELQGNIAHILRFLLKKVQSETDDKWGVRRVEEYHQTLSTVSLPEPAKNRILPQTVLEAIRKHAPPDIIITTDVGSHKIFTALNWHIGMPNHYFVSNGLSAMGFGLTAAIAAAKVTGDTVICITGDAGLAMVIGELTLITQYDLPVIVVVMNDSALDLIRSAQKRRQKPIFGTEFSNPNYELIASAYGIEFYHVENEADCEKAIDSALNTKKAALIEVMVDPIGYPTTPKA